MTRRRTARSLVAVVMLGTLSVGCTDEPNGSEEATSAVSALADGSGDAAELVQVVSSDGLSGNDASAVVGVLPQVIDAVGESAVAGGPIARRDAVRFFAELMREGRHVELGESLSTWIADTVEAVGLEAPRAEIEDALGPAVQVVAAAEAGADEADGEEDGGQFENRVTAAARGELARRVANATGIDFGDLEPREYTELISTHFDGDPIEVIDLGSSREVQRLGPDDDWPSPS